MRSELKNLQQIYLNHIKEKTLPLPRIIHVETRSKCNAFCNFCPASVNADTRKDIYMPDELIARIIDDLSKVNYPNRLSFYNNNEPFLDGRIFQIIKNAREKIPRAYLELKSNGSILTTESILKVFNAGLDMLYISYSSDTSKDRSNIEQIKKDLEKIRRLKGHMEEGVYFTRIKIESRDVNRIMGSRCGYSPNKAYQEKPQQKMCLRPSEMMTISPEGKVSVCSEDFYYTINMGNIQKEGLINIWRSIAWDETRYKLLGGKRDYHQACSKCDYKGFTYEMLKENGLYRKPFSLRLKKSIKMLIKG
ncbi:MAG: SPASM domain-containing protein [Candidatus Omnitrophica bacterium]|nr:SPASM domain-containing protein [Candidatus Omnitrophota bacterium]